MRNSDQINRMNFYGIKIIRSLEKHGINVWAERYFRTTSNVELNAKLKSSKYEGKFMNKIMHKGIPKRKRYPNRQPNNDLLTLKEERIANPHITRRVLVLNKIFMKHISDLMATGEVANNLLGRGIEISHVKLTNDFQIVQVFWFSYQTHILNETTEILNSIAYKLRHELTQLKVIGVVPIIQFVRDAQAMSMLELEQKFLTADYGDDFEPTITTAPKPQLTLFTKLPDEVRNKIMKTKIEDVSNETVDDSQENDDDDDDNIYNVYIPPMKHDVLGFDHWKILSTIKQSLNKSKEASRDRLDSDSSTMDTMQIESYRENMSAPRTAEEDQAFIDFLKQRQIQERRISKHEQDPKIFQDTFNSEQEFEPYEPKDDYDKDADDFDDIQSSQFH